MNEARALIAAFRELNGTSDRKVALFTSSLISLFGSTGMFNDFLAQIDAGLVNGSIPEEVKKRAVNLAEAYIPQVANLNNIKNFNETSVSPETLRGVRNDSAENRKQGTRVILAALRRILQEVNTVS